MTTSRNRTSHHRGAIVLALALTLAVAPPFSVSGSAAGDAPVPPADPEAFTLTGVEAAAERDAPEICAHFSRIPDPEQAAAGLAALLGEDGAPLPLNLSRRGRSLCLSGAEHGKRYRLTLSGDLRGVSGRTLGNAVEQAVAVPERQPSLAFRDAGFLLTRMGDGRSDGELALRSINVATAQLRLWRLADADGVERAYFDAADPTLVDRLGRDAREVWSGAMALGPQRNRPLTTALPLEALAGRLEPGVYVAIADGDGGARSVQWFIVSDLALNTVIGDDGLLVFARSRATAVPAEGVALRVIARDRSAAAQTRTAADGLARIDAAQLSGSQERAPQVLLARRGDNVAVIELTGPRVADAPGTPGALAVASLDETPFQRSRLDAFVAVDRPAYAPGDTVNAVALLRDSDGREAVGENLLAELRRPDGALAARLPLVDAGGGGYVFSLRLPGAAAAGDWRLSLHEEAGEEALGAVALRVDDALPLGLGLNLAAEAIPADPTANPPTGEGLRLNLRTLAANGRPAAGLAGQVWVVARPPAAGYARHPGFAFSRADMAGERLPLGGFVSDAEGRATLTAALPAGLPFRSAFDLRIEAEIAVAGSPAARAETTLPYRPVPLAVGLRPRFDGGGVPDGATVAFDVLAVNGTDGQPAALSGLSYELVREETEFAWFDNQGRWDYRAVPRDRPVAGGTIDVADDRPAVISEPVGAGRFRLEVRDPVSGATASQRFSAGWWMSPQAGARPDRVEVVAIRPGAGDKAAGDKAWVFIRPPYDSEVLILAADQRVRHAETRNIGPDGAFIEISADAGARAGLHIIATAFPTPGPAGRGPARRAVGTAWLPATGGPRRLPLTVEAGKTADSAGGGGASLTLRVKNDDGGPVYAVAALLPGEGAAFADPAAYFFGERALEVGLRDMYGRLITPPSRVAAAPGAPAVGAALKSAPAGAAWLSPVTRLGDDGAATLPLALPPGAPGGSYRVVALAWGGAAMGRADVTTALDAGPAAGRAGDAPPPPPWRRVWSGEIPANGEAAPPPTDVDAAGLTLTAGLTLVESATAADLDLGDAASRLTARTPLVGADAAASRLLALQSLELRGLDGAAVAGAALDELLALQRPDGAFAAWDAAGPAEPWLTAFAVDVLTRREKAGQAGGGLALGLARDWLHRWWDGCWTDPANLSACAYTLALLTEAKKLDAGAVAFFADGFAAQLPSETARVHLALAFDNVGDRRQAEAAMTRIAGGRRVDAATRDYGSALRDAAAAVALLAERRAPAELLAAAAGRLQRTRATAFVLTNQEAAWTLAAARALAGQAPVLGLYAPGAALSPSGPVPYPRRVSLLAPLAAGSDGAAPSGSQRLTDIAGAPLDPLGLSVGDTAAVVIDVALTPENRPRLLRLTAPLPDGVRALTRLAVTGLAGADGEARDGAAVLRSRRDATGVVGVVSAPANVSRISLSYLAQAGRDGALTLPAAVLEQVGGNNGPGARMLVPALPLSVRR